MVKFCFDRQEEKKKKSMTTDAFPNSLTMGYLY